MAKITKFEKEFAKEVRDFCQKHNLTTWKIGDSKEVQYHNNEKLKEFFYNEKGTISGNLIGRIKDFMRSYERKKK